ncbi:DHH family phosphoesterase [bacterium 1xD8-48]|nr:DHH family phosphoesterase [Lachnospiraceae bacterium]NBJ99306.1 DHH family phosphoesterase [bacterium 1xD8-48]
MKSGIKLKGRLKRYVQTSLYLGFLLIVVNLLVYLLSVPAGLVVTGFAVLYFGVVLALQFYSKPVIINELVSFATQYGQIQRVLLREFMIPYAILDDEGYIIWTNRAFEKAVHKEKGYRKSITSLFPSITREKLPGESEFAEVNLTFENNFYSAKMRKIPMREMVDSSDIVEAEEYKGYLVAFYLFDETALKIALKEVEDQSLAVGLIYLDNYDEALESVEEVRRSLLIALIDRKINKYIAAQDGICKKMEKDKYMVVLRRKAAEVLQEEKFDILEEVKTVNIGNEMAVTISIGLGVDGYTYAQNYEFARNAIDLALGRGGDQAVVKTPRNITYFGGKSQQVEKNTRVKARVKAQALREIISGKERVLIMGHRIPDADSFGAAVGIYRIAKTLDREAHIVLSGVGATIQPVLDLFKSHDGYRDSVIIDGQQAMELAGSNTVLVVVDVNKPSITECPELLRICKSIVVLDHHRQGSEAVENATLSYVEAYASSTCEMVSEILQYIGESIRITAEEANCMYSGMMIDTNNFTAKTGVRTFEAAAFLRRNGADVTKVRKLFREDAIEYKTKADAVSQAEIYKHAFAISICKSENIQSPTVVGAQAANELLNIKGVKASFVLTDYQNQVFISARSIDEVNVQVIMEKMGGGGHLGIAGCQLTGVSVFEGIGLLKGTLDKMINEGDLVID